MVSGKFQIHGHGYMYPTSALYGSTKYDSKKSYCLDGYPTSPGSACAILFYIITLAAAVYCAVTCTEYGSNLLDEMDF